MKLSKTSFLIAIAAAVTVMLLVDVLMGDAQRRNTKDGVGTSTAPRAARTATSSDAAGMLARTIDNGVTRQGPTSSAARATPQTLPDYVISPGYLPKGYKLRRFGTGAQGKTLLVYSKTPMTARMRIADLKSGDYFTVEQSRTSFDDSSGDAITDSAQISQKSPLNEKLWRGPDELYYRIRGELSKEETLRIARSLQH